MARPTLPKNELSEDALNAAIMFRPNPNLDLHFRTPHRIHPRFMAALDELVALGAIKQTADEEKGVKYRAADIDLIRSLRKPSMKDLRKNKLPIMVD